MKARPICARGDPGGKDKDTGDESAMKIQVIKKKKKKLRRQTDLNGSNVNDKEDEIQPRWHCLTLMG